MTMFPYQTPPKDIMRHPPLMSGAKIFPFNAITGEYTLQANRDHFLAVAVKRQMVIDALAALRSVTAGNVRMGIYDVTTGQRLGYSAAVAAPGVEDWVEHPITPLTLYPGRLYAIGANSDTVGTMAVYTVSLTTLRDGDYYPMTSPINGIINHVATKDRAYAEFPSTYDFSGFTGSIAAALGVFTA